MIVSGSQIQQVIKLYGEQNKITKTTSTDKAGSVQKKDEVILSSEAQGFGQILKTLNTMPEVREDRVKGLSEQISSGNYNVTSKEIAEKMLGRLAVDCQK
jgi:negative regulator of flagellin synthesis FlgM